MPAIPFWNVGAVTVSVKELCAHMATLCSESPLHNCLYCFTLHSTTFPCHTSSRTLLSAGMALQGMGLRVSWEKKRIIEIWSLYILFGTRTFSEHLYFPIIQETPLLASERSHYKRDYYSNGGGGDGLRL